jgi:predicted dehydrogenase
MKTVNFGIIGCGLMGREFASAAARWLHLKDPAAVPKIVAVADTQASARQWFEGHFPGIFSTDNAEALLARPDVEAVYIAVPHNLHRDLYLKAIRAGKHLLGEKPFGLDQPACRDILAALKENPEVTARCSSEFPFFPGAQRLFHWGKEGRFGRILAVNSGFLHSSDLDPAKPINWKRRVATCGAYGVMADLGMHVLHLPLRLGYQVHSVHAVLSKVVPQRPDGKGGMAECETWDNALLTCRASGGNDVFPMSLRTERIAPGETDTWYLEVLGTRLSARFSTRQPRLLEFMDYAPGKPQTWQQEALGYETQSPTITGSIFEFGFTDAILQMWAAYLNELAGQKTAFGCATPDEAFETHRIFTAALESQEKRQEISLI